MRRHAAFSALAPTHGRVLCAPAEPPLAIRIGRAWLVWILFAATAFWAALGAAWMGASPAWLLVAPAALSPLFGAVAAGLVSDDAFDG